MNLDFRLLISVQHPQQWKTTRSGSSSPCKGRLMFVDSTASLQDFDGNDQERPIPAYRCHAHSLRWRVEPHPEVPHSFTPSPLHSFIVVLLCCPPMQQAALELLFVLFSPGSSRPTSPKSDSELMTKPLDADNTNPTMHWAWGELPQAATVSKCQKVMHLIQFQVLSLMFFPHLFLLLQPSFLPVKPDPPPVCPVSIPVSQSTHFRVINRKLSSEQCGPCSEISALRLMMPGECVEDEEDEEAASAVRMDSDCVRLEPQSESTGSREAAGASAAATLMMCDTEEPLCRPPGKTDSPSKRKGEGWLKTTCELLIT